MSVVSAVKMAKNALKYAKEHWSRKWWVFVNVQLTERLEEVVKGYFCSVFYFL